MAATQDWEDMARRLKLNDAEERPWFLLARKRAEDLKKAIAERREIIIRELNEAEHAKQLGDTQKALAIQNRILTHYSHYTDVADLLERAGLKSPQPHPVPPPAEPLPPPPTADAMTPELPSQ